MFGYCLSDSKITFNFAANIVFACEYYLCSENLDMTSKACEIVDNMKKIIKIVLKWIIYAAVFPHNFVKGFIYGWNLEKH